MAAVTHLGSAFQESVNRVFNEINNAKSTNIFNIEAKFMSLNFKAPIEFSREIDRLTITQDFFNGFRDKIIIDLRVSVGSYKWMFVNRSELYCDLIFTRVDVKNLANERCNAGVVFAGRFKCVLLTCANPDSAIPASVNESENKPEHDYNRLQYQIKVELIDMAVYAAMKKNFSNVFKGNGTTSVTVESIIYYTIAQFGFLKAVVMPVDNETKYINFVIPPSYRINEIMQYLQESPGHGVYNNGICSYIHNGTWFVYPRYGGYINKYPITIYRLAPGMYAGLERYDLIEATSDGELCMSILFMDDVEERNLAFIGYENNPNATSVQISSEVIDHCRTMDADGKYTINPQIYNLNHIRHQADTPDESTSMNMVFDYSHNNVYAARSVTSALDQTRLKMTLRAVSPFIFHPGSIVKYAYEHKSGDKLVASVLTGGPEFVHTEFVRDTTSRTYPIFFGTSEVSILCNNSLARQGGVM